MDNFCFPKYATTLRNIVYAYSPHFSASKRTFLFISGVVTTLNLVYNYVSPGSPACVFVDVLSETCEDFFSEKFETAVLSATKPKIRKVFIRDCGAKTSSSSGTRESTVLLVHD